MPIRHDAGAIPDPSTRRVARLLSLAVYVTTTGGSIATDTMTYEVTKSMVEDGSVAMSYNLYEMDAHRGVDQHGRALPRRPRRIGQDAREHAVRDALAVVGANDATRPACVCPVAPPRRAPARRHAPAVTGSSRSTRRSCCRGNAPGVRIRRRDLIRHGGSALHTHRRPPCPRGAVSHEPPT